jgi:hypothetical protein
MYWHSLLSGRPVVLVNLGNPMKEPIIFNKSLDREPLLFSVIPPNLLIPMSLFFSFDAFVFLLCLKVNWVFVVVAFAVENIIWIILTARGTHTFLSRFERPPYWVNTCRKFKPILPIEYIDFQVKEQIM